MKKILILVLLLIGITNTSFAEQSATVGGITKYCDETLDAINSTKEVDKNKFLTFDRVVEHTVLGFLSGLNFWYEENSGNLKNLWHDIVLWEDEDYIYSYVINYCKRNPKDKLIHAAMDYFNTLPDLEE